jgi:hypothetical protein
VLRKLYRVFDFVKIWRKSRPTITNISSQAREQEIRHVAATYGTFAARRARAITLMNRNRERRDND